MLRLLLLISLVLSSLTLVESTSAAVTYTPGAMIAMTGTSTWVAGTNTSARFDVASALHALRMLYPTDYIENPPALDTRNPGNLTFTGTFYGSGIGWIVFASGANQVTLSCSEALDVLTSNCTLTGTGWSENVGDIYFSSGTTITYDPYTGRLSGSAITFVGDISLTDIVLPLMPIELKESSLTANHAATLTVSGAWMYDGGELGWQISTLAGLDSQTKTSLNGEYNIDLSIANGHYVITITDPNDSKTEITEFVVSPGAPENSLESKPYHASEYCGRPTTLIPDSNCPDGSIRSATALTQLPPTGGSPVVANGSDAYTLTLRARDQYGNRVETGNMRISYDTTVKNIQTEDNFYFYSLPSNYGSGDAFISNKLPTDITGFGTSEKTLPLNSAIDITYTIASTAPTGTNNEIKLNSITYSSGSVDTTLALGNPSLDFTPLFSASVDGGTISPIINTPHTFQTTVTKNGTTSIIPTIITTMQIGDGSSGEWRSLSSAPAAECDNYPTNTDTGLCSWDGVSSIATASSSDFSFTGTYTTWLPDSLGEETTMTGYIYYPNLGKDILYRVNLNSILAATARSPRITVLGQSGEGVGGGSRARVDLINGIRKQAALLSRNRLANDPYIDADYRIINGSHIVTSSDLDAGAMNKAKRTIIVLGGDIKIDANIDIRGYPIALIALTDSSGMGGNIGIKGTVTDIHSSLIAEHAITSENSSNQLYIHGMLVSANPPREIAPTGCPYFVAAGCTRSDYDLPGSRDAYAALTPADKILKQSASGSLYPSPLVIEGDPRIIRDPAPAMSK